MAESWAVFWPRNRRQTCENLIVAVSCFILVMSDRLAQLGQDKGMPWYVITSARLSRLRLPGCNCVIALLADVIELNNTCFCWNCFLFFFKYRASQPIPSWTKKNTVEYRQQNIVFVSFVFNILSVQLYHLSRHDEPRRKVFFFAFNFLPLYEMIISRNIYS